MLGKNQYDELIRRIERIEDRIDDADGRLFESWRITREHIERYIKEYIDRNCEIHIQRVNENYVKAELRQKIMNNLFGDK